jgi:N,N'-diacetyllegionaminate synthase
MDPESRVFVIAEAGSTHDGDFNKALRLIDQAALAGANAIKFQFWSDADALADRRRVPAEYREIYRRYQMPRDWMPSLAIVSKFTGIEFMCTTYLERDIPLVEPWVQRFKVSSFEAADAAFVHAHEQYGRPILVSLGMSNGIPWHLEGCGKIALLHCVSAYPAPPEAMNLAVFQGDWGEPYDPAPSPFVGFSDHSRHPWMGALAVAAGATIIEAHLRLPDTDPSNPDYATAFDRAEFAEYVRHIRFAERVRGTGEKALQPCERAMAAFRVQS